MKLKPSTWDYPAMTPPIMTKMAYEWEESRCVLMEVMEAFAMIPGTTVMPLWCAISWGSLHMVLMTGLWLLSCDLWQCMMVLGAVAVNADSFSEGNVERLLTNVDCLGNETNLLDCSHSFFQDFICVTSGAICQGKKSGTVFRLLCKCLSIALGTPNGLCISGETRLELTSEDVLAGSREGRLELCINNAWGAVCDSLFDVADAAVACSRIAGFSQEGNFNLEV